MSLNVELSKFWGWAKISFEEYIANVLPPAARQPEWEGEYPDWSQLEKAATSLITALNNGLVYTRDDLRDILTVVAIDNESENLQQFIVVTVTDFKLLRDLVNEAYSFESFHARWQMVETIRESRIDNKVAYLESFIVKDTDKYVQRRALIALSDLDPDLGMRYAKTRINDSDEYMRLASLEILQGDSNYAFYKDVLKNDPSPLIQQQLKQ
jgi:hypothetical protein